MDCAVSELRARNGRGRIPQSGEAAGPYRMCCWLEVVSGSSVSSRNGCTVLYCDAAPCPCPVLVPVLVCPRTM